MCGAFCAKCQTNQPFKRHLTVNQLPAYKAVDVIGHELGCGHYFGKADFMKIQETVNNIKAKAVQKHQDIEDATQIEIIKAVAGLTFKDSGK